MFKPTNSALLKVEQILKDVGYDIIYEKGSFQSGYCLVESRKIAVVNKFFQTEARINTLIDIIVTLEVDQTVLSKNALKTYRSILQNIEDAAEN